MLEVESSKYSYKDNDDFLFIYLFCYLILTSLFLPQETGFAFLINNQMLC